MPDRERKPATSGVGEVRSSPPPRPSVPPRAAKPFGGGAVPWPVPPSLLGVILGGIALGLIMLHLLCHALRSSPVRSGPTDQARDPQAADRADSNWKVPLPMLAIAEDLPTEHAKQMWILAANLANEGYLLSTRDRPLRMTVEDLNLATIGSVTVQCPDAEPYILEWRLDRGHEGEEDVRSFLAIENLTGHFSSQMAHQLARAWLHAGRRIPDDAHGVCANLIREATLIFEADNEGRTWNGPEGKSFEITRRSSEAFGKGARAAYDLELEESVGKYRFQLVLRDNRGEVPGWSRVLVWFIYLPEKSVAPFQER